MTKVIVRLLALVVVLLAVLIGFGSMIGPVELALLMLVFVAGVVAIVGVPLWRSRTGTE